MQQIELNRYIHIAKKLEKILRQHIVFNKNYSLKNSLELVELTKTITIEPRHTLASFDIVNLYTNVPVSYTHLDVYKRQFH